jgi:nicotinate-nucleotide adenylyltransferase
MQKLAILGGTFNPVHRGHLLMATTALRQYALDQVLWVPTPTPPHKPSADLANFSHRLEMIKQAIAPYPTFAVSEIERQRAGRSYALHTFLDLQEAYPARQWFWIVGLDAFQSLPRWYRRHEWVDRCRWLVAPRPLGEPSDLCASHIQAQCQQVAEQMRQQGNPIDWDLLPMPLIGVSSSLVRQYCRDHRPIDQLVPESVQAYIAMHQLYQGDRLDQGLP